MKIIAKQIILLLITVFFIISIGELFARFYLGLGTPPLLIEDSNIEYMFKPNQDIHRFGNHIVINQYGMRSEPFAPHRKENEFRIMVFGDSVLNGGNQTDQSELSTAILQKKMTDITAKKVVVGNISAGSWGPGNWLSYAKKYGFFEADAVILVISSHDYADNPKFQPLNPNTHPTEKPLSALIEGITRYLPRYVPDIFVNNQTNEPDHFSVPSSEEVTKGLDDLKEFLFLAKKSTKSVLVFQYWEREEVISEDAKVGNIKIRDLCESIGISPIQLLPYFKKAIQNGKKPYRDNIHPNQLGQALIAKTILKTLTNKKR